MTDFVHPSIHYDVDKKYDFSLLPLKIDVWKSSGSFSYMTNKNLLYIVVCLPKFVTFFCICDILLYTYIMSSLLMIEVRVNYLVLIFPCFPEKLYWRINYICLCCRQSRKVKSIWSTLYTFYIYVFLRNIKF